ncbi:MAG: GNAT family N-acetyltransferase [Kofleriaceae bacterium]|nr:GNAT family N-acetyltransferase [Planctomycetota bacterium]MCA9675589.1 GNAT family N-acetyltransferase [Myxococcales bacterium]MCB9559653.1 GNAT family N-acetyltransferase [Kofleriaceae bacterium]
MQELVRLRPIEEADVDDILGWVNDPEIIGNIAAFSGHAFTREQELTWVRSVRVSRTEVVFSILAAAGGHYLGQCGIHQIHDRSKVGRLACIIANRAEMGRGYGSAAIRALLDHAFGPLGLHKVWLMVFAHNTRGRGIYGRIGFREEGVLREEYFHEGGWHDMVRMSMLAREWQAIRDGGGRLPQQ